MVFGNLKSGDLNPDKKSTGKRVSFVYICSDSLVFKPSSWDGRQQAPVDSKGNIHSILAHDNFEPLQIFILRVDLSKSRWYSKSNSSIFLLILSGGVSVNILEDFIKSEFTESLHRISNSGWEPSERETVKTLSCFNLSESIEYICVHAWVSLTYENTLISYWWHNLNFMKQLFVFTWANNLPAFCIWRYQVGTPWCEWYRMKGYLPSYIFCSNPCHELLPLF